MLRSWLQTEKSAEAQGQGIMGQQSACDRFRRRYQYWQDALLCNGTAEIQPGRGAEGRNDMSIYNDLMDLAYVVTCTMLDLNPADKPQNIIPFDLTDDSGVLTDPHSDVVLYHVQFDNRDSNRQIDTTVKDESPVSLNRQTRYVRTLRILWQIYGDDGFEWADRMRIKLFSPDVQSLLAAKGISLVTDVQEAQYVAEKVGQQWFRRYDLNADFNHLVTLEETVPTVASAEINVTDKKGVVSICSILNP